MGADDIESDVVSQACPALAVVRNDHQQDACPADQLEFA